VKNGQGSQATRAQGETKKRSPGVAVARAVLVGAVLGSGGIEAAGAAFIVYLVVTRRPLPSWATQMDSVKKAEALLGMLWP
jgi:hypothetical protein